MPPRLSAVMIATERRGSPEQGGCFAFRPGDVELLVIHHYCSPPSGGSAGPPEAVSSSVSGLWLSC
jgi:hypothetical protein